MNQITKILLSALVVVDINSIANTRAVVDCLSMHNGVQIGELVMNNERYEVQVKTTLGKWSISQECHLLGELDKNGYHKTAESASDALKNARNDGRDRRVIKV